MWLYDKKIETITTTVKSEVCDFELSFEKEGLQTKVEKLKILYKDVDRTYFDHFGKVIKLKHQSLDGFNENEVHDYLLNLIDNNRIDYVVLTYMKTTKTVLGSQKVSIESKPNKIDVYLHLTDEQLQIVKDTMISRKQRADELNSQNEKLDELLSPSK